ncbi:MULTISPECIES: hypothetical protein [Streptomyces]|uniref:Uncharacterized protein n=1 Tax=Streptomyces mordarskii TaxID=1226758 RepID=A0ABN1D0B0_9ACTN|nr:hypothetical protein OG546_45745 [Streptomyces antimycoticus]
MRPRPVLWTAGSPPARPYGTSTAIGGCSTSASWSRIPLLWHELDPGARRSLERGTSRHGTEILRLLGRRLDNTATRGILGASGLE